MIVTRPQNDPVDVKLWTSRHAAAEQREHFPKSGPLLQSSVLSGRGFCAPPSEIDA